jgi:hypothetical protein
MNLWLESSQRHFPGSQCRHNPPRSLTCEGAKLISTLTLGWGSFTLSVLHARRLFCATKKHSVHPLASKRLCRRSLYCSSSALRFLRQSADFLVTLRLWSGLLWHPRDAQEGLGITRAAHAMLPCARLSKAPQSLPLAERSNRSVGSESGRSLGHKEQRFLPRAVC